MFRISLSTVIIWCLSSNYKYEEWKAEISSAGTTLNCVFYGSLHLGMSQKHIGQNKYIWTPSVPAVPSKSSYKDVVYRKRITIKARYRHHPRDRVKRGHIRLMHFNWVFLCSKRKVILIVERSYYRMILITERYWYKKCNWKLSNNRPI